MNPLKGNNVRRIDCFKLVMKTNTEKLMSSIKQVDQRIWYPFVKRNHNILNGWNINIVYAIPKPQVYKLHSTPSQCPSPTSTLSPKMTFLLYQRRTLYSLGFTLNPNESVLWQVFVFVHTMSLAVLFVAESSFVYFNLDDLMLATDAACAAMYCTLALPKLFAMQLRRKRWYRLWADLEELWHKGG